MRNLKDYVILIVDDDIDLREIMVNIFESEGFKTLSANSGNQALITLNSNKIDLVISDIRMADGDGIYLLGQIRARDPKAPIVFFVTGYADLAEAAELARSGVKIFSKPFKREDLIEATMQALETIS